MHTHTHSHSHTLTLTHSIRARPIRLATSTPKPAGSAKSKSKAAASAGKSSSKRNNSSSKKKNKKKEAAAGKRHQSAGAAQKAGSSAGYSSSRQGGASRAGNVSSNETPRTLIRGIVEGGSRSRNSAEKSESAPGESQSLIARAGSASSSAQKKQPRLFSLPDMSQQTPRGLLKAVLSTGTWFDRVCLSVVLDLFTVQHDDNELTLARATLSCSHVGGGRGGHTSTRSFAQHTTSGASCTFPSHIYCACSQHASQGHSYSPYSRSSSNTSADADTSTSNTSER
jgi:hypothetical protein